MAWTLCLLVAVLTVVALSVDLVTGKPERLATRISDWSFTTFAIPLAIVGALITARRPGNRIGLLLLIGGLSISVEGGVPLVVEKRANAGSDTDAMRRQ
jgi:hypothetical protein